MPESVLHSLQDYFGDRLQENVSLARYTTARVGGPVHWFVESTSHLQLAADARFSWDHNLPFRVIGNGSNILVSDSGWDGLALLNQARTITFYSSVFHPELHAQSGASLSAVVRRTAELGLSGLEWAAGIPGTVGGAIYGNAGAHGQDISQSLALAVILHREKGMLSLSSEQMEYSYRSSFLKKYPGSSVILSATFKLSPASPELVREKVESFNEKRRSSQPAGASLGSTFKNPNGDYAGRLIEAAGLKGKKIGGVQVSPIHANFLVNDDSATAEDYHQLIRLIQNTVKQMFAVNLELEIEILGEWQD